MKAVADEGEHKVFWHWVDAEYSLMTIDRWLGDCNMPFEKPTPEQLANRFTYHAPKGDQAERYQTVRTAILDAARTCVDFTPCCPEQSRALNALDEAMFLFNASIARNE